MSRARRSQPEALVTPVGLVCSARGQALVATSLAELRQADVDPVEDWAVWYAEYLLGVR